MLKKQRATEVLPDRRAFLALCSTFGLSTTLFPGLLWGDVQREKKITRSMIDHAAILAGVDIPDDHKEMMLEGLSEQVGSFGRIHALELQNEVASALLFDPVPPDVVLPSQEQPMRMSRTPLRQAPKDIEQLAFASVRELAELLRKRRVSSVALTEMYLERLKRYDPLLRFVITLTTDRAMAQAREADREIAAGKYRGPLHGVPWGAKDLLSVRGYPTTWGASGLEQQEFDFDAAVVRRLDRAGAVLLAKLTLGTLAMGGDEWFGGVTRNPWRPEQGASGSSAGSASAVAAGCVGFSLGSETLDSIAAPAARCGVTGLRPTFGRVSRAGAMALCWSLDKVGPICRSGEDCALVLAEINGADAEDRATRDVPFNWDSTIDTRSLRVGHLSSEFRRAFTPIPGHKPGEAASRLDNMELTSAAVEELRTLGIDITEAELPDYPWRAITLTIAKAEAAAAFDEVTRLGRDILLPHQERNWPNTFRTARFIPAVEYINANRARTLGMKAMAALFEQFDVLVAPTDWGTLVPTNLTGHPAVILPIGFKKDGTPASLTFVGNLFGEAKILALAHAYQTATSWHRQRPSL